VQSKIFGFLILLLSAVSAFADDRLNVCSVTINSDDEIRTFKKYLPESQFRFIELTSPSADWLGDTCEAGIRCDVLVLSGHFGNTWAGDYGTTFAGRSGKSLSLAALEQRRCDESCQGVIGDPLEVFLFGCKTLNADSGAALSPHDLALLDRHQLPATSAARILDEAGNGGEDSSSLRRMQFVFGGVPHVYGFTDVAPAGMRVAPLLEKYLRQTGDYAAHLRRMRAERRLGSVASNDALAAALEPTCFTQTSGLNPAGADYARSSEACFLADERNSLARRRERVDDLFDGPRFLGSLTAIDRFLKKHPVSLLESGHAGARSVSRELLGNLENPVLRLELARVARNMGWVSDSEALVVERQVVLRLLRPPVYGDGRNLICGLGDDVLRRIDVRAEDVPTATYQDEYGIQALGCLKPTDERIQERLAQSLLDSRDWIARLAATVLRDMRGGGR